MVSKWLQTGLAAVAVMLLPLGAGAFTAPAIPAGRAVARTTIRATTTRLRVASIDKPTKSKPPPKEKEKVTKEAQELLDKFDDRPKLLVAQVAPAVRYVVID